MFFKMVTTISQDLLIRLSSTCAPLAHMLLSSESKFLLNLFSIFFNRE